MEKLSVSSENGGVDMNDVSTNDDHTSSRGSAPSPLTNSTTPDRLSQSQQWQQHISLADFTLRISQASKAAFPVDNRSRYENVSVLLMYWDEMDPRLPVDREIATLRSVFEDDFHFKTNVFKIPPYKSHSATQRRVLDFSDDCHDNDLKIVYYGGHSKSIQGKQLHLFTRPNADLGTTPGFKSEVVDWTAIQATLEQSSGDALVLLDCCQSGIMHLGEARERTELLVACNYESEANGVGPWSFTHDLVIELKYLLWKKGRFTVAELWSGMYQRMQSHLPMGVHNERYPPPVHFPMMRPHGGTKSIVLYPLPRTVLDNEQHHLRTKRRRIEKDDKEPGEHGLASLRDLNSSPSSERNMLIAIRLQKTATSSDIEEQSFMEWLAGVPAPVEMVQLGVKWVDVQALFESDSSILIATVSLPLWTCMRGHPAIMSLGPVRSSNIWKPTFREAGDDPFLGAHFDRVVGESPLFFDGSNNLVSHDQQTQQTTLGIHTQDASESRANLDVGYHPLTPDVSGSCPTIDE